MKKQLATWNLFHTPLLNFLLAIFAILHGISLKNLLPLVWNRSIMGIETGRICAVAEKQKWCQSRYLKSCLYLTATLKTLWNVHYYESYVLCVVQIKCFTLCSLEEVDKGKQNVDLKSQLGSKKGRGEWKCELTKPLGMEKYKSARVIWNSFDDFYHSDKTFPYWYALRIDHVSHYRTKVIQCMKKDD